MDEYIAKILKETPSNENGLPQSGAETTRPGMNEYIEEILEGLPGNTDDLSRSDAETSALVLASPDQQPDDSASTGTEAPAPQKRCNWCKLRKPESEYYANRRKGIKYLFGQCKTCTLAKQRARLQTPDGAAHRKRTVARYTETHTEQIREKNQKYQPIANQRAVERRKTDPNFRLSGAIRRRIVAALHGQVKGGKTVALLGCTLEHFYAWLEHQFTDSMTWKNYGSWWEIDHVRPCCSFDLGDLTQQRKCFSWMNQRPMRVGLNRAKNGRRDELEELAHREVLYRWSKLRRAALVRERPTR